jgi:hypothetical protein
VDFFGILPKVHTIQGAVASPIGEWISGGSSPISNELLKEAKTDTVYGPFAIGPDCA